MGCEFRLGISITVENIGPVTGSEVVQVYISLPATSKLTHPPLQLKGFAKAHDLIPGNKEQLEVVLDKYAVSYWNVVKNAWTVEKGVYGVQVEVGTFIFSFIAMLLLVLTNYYLHRASVNRQQQVLQQHRGGRTKE